VVANEEGVQGKIINESLVDERDLMFFNSTLLNEGFTFKFDSAANEAVKQERFEMRNRYNVESVKRYIGTTTVLRQRFNDSTF